MNVKHKVFFEGEYDQGQREGYGRAIFDNGNMFEGEWEEWAMHG